jgi:hypothetical protein
MTIVIEWIAAIGADKRIANIIVVLRIDVVLVMVGSIDVVVVDHDHFVVVDRLLLLLSSLAAATTLPIIRNTINEMTNDSSFFHLHLMLAQSLIAIVLPLKCYNTIR